MQVTVYKCNNCGKEFEDNTRGLVSVVAYTGVSSDSVKGTIHLYVTADLCIRCGTTMLCDALSMLNHGPRIQLAEHWKFEGPVQ